MMNDRTLKNRSSNFSTLFTEDLSKKLHDDMERRVIELAMGIAQEPIDCRSTKSGKISSYPRRAKGLRSAKKIVKKCKGTLRTPLEIGAYKTVIRAHNRKARRFWKTLPPEEQDRRLAEARKTVFTWAVMPAAPFAYLIYRSGMMGNANAYLTKETS